MKDLLFFFFIIIFFAVSAWFIIFFRQYECRNRAHILEREHKYSFATGCFLKSDSGKFLPADAFAR